MTLPHFHVGDWVRARVSVADVRVGMIGIVRSILVAPTITYVVSFADVFALKFMHETALELV
jgi:hypothetical protein